MSQTNTNDLTQKKLETLSEVDSKLIEWIYLLSKNQNLLDQKLTMQIKKVEYCLTKKTRRKFKKCMNC
jgi:hypothetical protein